MIAEYGLSFRFCFLRVIDILRYIPLATETILIVHFVLESGHVNFGDAERIVNFYKRYGSSDIAGMLRTITAGNEKDFLTYKGETLVHYHSMGEELQKTTTTRIITFPRRLKERLWNARSLEALRLHNCARETAKSQALRYET